RSASMRWSARSNWASRPRAAAARAVAAMAAGGVRGICIEASPWRVRRRCERTARPRHSREGGSRHSREGGSLHSQEGGSRHSREGGNPERPDFCNQGSPPARETRRRLSNPLCSPTRRSPMALFSPDALNPGVRKREVFGWAMYDFANSGYTTVVITAVFAAYFVNGIAAKAPWATFAWTLALSIS